MPSKFLRCKKDLLRHSVRETAPGGGVRTGSPASPELRQL